MQRRQVLGRFAVAALSAAGGAVRAQNFPAKPLRIIVPYAAGGSPDAVARILAQQLGTVMGQPVLVENLPGSSGIAAIEIVRNGAADGYTLLMADAAHWAVNRVTKAKLPHNFQKDMAPVSIASYSALFLAVHETFPASNLRELVAAVKAKPGTYTYGSSGVGSLHHLTMEAFKQGLGLDILHVPYRGTGQSVPALVGGQVHMAVAAYNSIGGFAKEGRVKIIAGNTRERMAMLAQFPPMGDAGLKDFHFPGENALFVPSGTPKPVIDRLAAAVAKVLMMPDIVAKLNAAGVEPPRQPGPAALAETIQRDIARYESVVRNAGIQPE
ncbi:MAG: tripartite tricarboxylate transporter substrate-binding protein [Burkholderiaceae bacterium]|nr:tripartite tricarboxylate transporter substrate-binding protein [Burkholderiaceae bacterium]